MVTLFKTKNLKNQLITAINLVIPLSIMSNSMSQLNNNDLWYAYLRAHEDERTRNLHYAGTLIGIGMFIAALLAMQPLLILAGVIAAYGLAWFGHFTIEKNKPAAFSRPILSFLYNFKMLWLWLNGEVDKEFEAALSQKPATIGDESPA